MLVHPDMSDALEPHTCHGVVRGRVPSASVPVLRKIHRVEVPDTFEPGISWRLTGLDTPEERLHRPVQTTQGRLLRRERPAPLPLRVERPDLFQLYGLVAVPDGRHRQMPIGVATFLQRCVVKRAVVGQHPGQCLRLPCRWTKKELVRTSHAYPPSHT